MRLCERAVEFVQVMNEDGAVRQCSWLSDGGVIGYLTQNSMEEIYQGPAARLIREMHLRNDHTNCDPNQCPYVANQTVDEHTIELEQIPRTPYSLYLAYENVCNYRCIMCDIPNCMNHADIMEREKKLDRIDGELRKILPYVRVLSANGLGELFASRHIMKLLSEWKPLAEPDEITVSLETNGSLFDEAHWSKIANLGNYKLNVAITVLSFDDATYREMSGTDQPVSKLIGNLHYVKSLRDQGIINFLELATVYQEKNFRQLPEFARMCIEEFNADSVRLRPYHPWGGEGMREWFMDVRNAYHPYHQEFLDVMKHPIFCHPKVHDWGAGNESGLGPEPYQKMRGSYRLLEGIYDEGFLSVVQKKTDSTRFVVYGMTVVGKSLVHRLRNSFEVPYCLDRKMEGQFYCGIPLHGINRFDTLEKNVAVIIALDRNEDVIESMLRREGYQDVLRIRDIIE